MASPSLNSLLLFPFSLLSSVVFSSVNSARAKARVGQAAAQLRQISTALNLYLDANGAYPCFDHAWDDTKEKAWSAPFLSTWPKNPWGTEYHWEHSIQGFTFSVSMRAPGTTEAQALDKTIDDNNLATGVIRGDGTRLEYGGMDQSVPFVDCHI